MVLGFTNCYSILLLTYKAVTFFGHPFQSARLSKINITKELYFLNVYTPQLLRHNAHRLSRDISLGSSLFAHHYLGNQLRFLFLALLRCFSSRRSLFFPMYSEKNILGLPRWVSPFGHLRIKA